MHRIFGTSKVKPKPTLSDAVASVEARVDSIDAKIKALEAELIKYRDQMKKMRDGPGRNAVRSRALRVLRQKHHYESQRDMLAQQVANLEQTLFAAENLKNVTASYDALRIASNEMKQQCHGMDVAKIEAIQDELEDLMEQANEVQGAIGRSYGVPEEIDESDLEAELSALGDDFSFEEDEVPSYLRQAELLEAPSAIKSDPGLEEELKLDEPGYSSRYQPLRTQ
ncbi:uncharacterized protein VTP21DRAFT_1962 [Calcarisporiella thermophila]|uniref:uncharacterized protein n=1 Tax=Calcarisporiella thermophila TaxID=911321 RepID=UPI0037432620